MAGEPTQVSLSAAIIIGSIPAIIAAVGTIVAQKALIKSNKDTNKTLSEERLKLFELEQKERYREILLPEKLKLYGNILDAISKFENQDLNVPSVNVLALMNSTDSVIASNTLLMPKEIREKMYSLRAEAAGQFISIDLNKTEPIVIYKEGYLRFRQIAELLHLDLGADELVKTPLQNPAPSGSRRDTNN